MSNPAIGVEPACDSRRKLFIDPGKAWQNGTDESFNASTAAFVIRPGTSDNSDHEIRFF